MPNELSLEVFGDPRGTLLQLPQVVHGFRFQCFFAACRLTGMDARFEIAVQIFIRVQCRGVRGQIKNLDLVLALGQPFLNLACVMGAQIVENQEDLALGI
jgi:hypothetical protein